jgi:NAD+ kinase
MKISVIGKKCPQLENMLRSENIKIYTPEEADLIVVYGGDGSLLGAERMYPGVPKYPIRDSETAPLCPIHSLEKQFPIFLDKKLERSMLPKLMATVDGNEKMFAINDIFVHNKIRTSALRYKVWIDGVLYAREIVGDGLGVATVHGATAYYRSITHSVFRVGIGLAFSNSTELVNHLVLPEDSVIKIKIIRGPGELTADNAPEMPLVKDGSECEIRMSDLKAEIYGLDFFMCPECRRLRHQMRREFIAEDRH